MSRVSQAVYTGALAKALGAGSHSCKGRACTGRPTRRFLMPLSFRRPDLPPHEFTASFHAAARVTVSTRKGRRCEGRGVPVPQKARGGTQLASSWSSAPSSPPASLQTGKPKPREAAGPSKLQGSKKQQNGGVGFCALFTQKPCWEKSAYGGTMNREKSRAAPIEEVEGRGIHMRWGGQRNGGRGCNNYSCHTAAFMRCL